MVAHGSSLDRAHPRVRCLPRGASRVLRAHRTRATVRMAPGGCPRLLAHRGRRARHPHQAAREPYTQRVRERQHRRHPALGFVTSPPAIGVSHVGADKERETSPQCQSGGREPPGSGPRDPPRRPSEARADHGRHPAARLSERHAEDLTASEATPSSGPGVHTLTNDRYTSTIDA